MTTVTRLRVFISSPGDVAQERAVARRVLGRIQGAHAGGLEIEPVFWEQQPLLASDSFQSQLLRPSECDLVVGVVWTRFGTPLSAAIRRPDGTLWRSGTEFEIEDALEAARATGRPKVLLYRKTAEPRRWFASPEDALEAAGQRRALDEFLDGLLRDRHDGTFVGAFHPFATVAEFEELLELHLLKLLPELAPGSAPDGPQSAATWSFGSPFRGLQSFEREHGAIFFGRTAATAEAIERLQEQAGRGVRFLLLLGMSGGGKSSIAKAGVLPMLMQPGVVGAADEWRHAVFTPGEGRGNLLLALAGALCSREALPTLGDPDALSQALRAVPTSVAPRVAAALDAAHARTDLALVVDQLEEMFSDPAVTDQERAAFVSALAALASGGRTWIVATLRSDYYPRCVELPALVALKGGAGQYDVLPPRPAEIAQMIRLPAQAAGLRFEQDRATGERLDERLRDLTAERPAALPLLEFTLEELYRRRSPEGLLTFAAYEEIGGLEGALAHRAETVYEAQSPAVRAALPRTLERLVEIGEDDVAVRRRASLDGFADSESNAMVHALVEARLLVTELGESGRSDVTVAHEALFRHWPRLVDWLESNRELLRIRSRVRAAAERWDGELRRGEFLLAQGKPLAEALALRNAGVPLDALEREFVVASEASMRRNRTLRRGAIAALAVLTLAAVVAAGIAVRQADIARREATTASRTSEFLASLFAVVDPGESRGNQITARELLDRGASKIRTELRGEPLVRAELLNTMGMAYSGLGLYEPALALTAEALAERMERLGRYHESTLRSQIAHARVLYQSAEYADSAAAFRDAIEMAGRIHPRGNLDNVRASLGLADVQTFNGDPAEAEQLYREGLMALERLPGDTGRDRVFALSGLATALYFQSRLDESARTFEQALELGTAVFGPDHPKVAETVNNLGSIAYQSGDFRRATALWQRALPMYRSIFGTEHQEVANVLNNLGRVALIERRFEDAERELRAALAMDRRFKGATHDDLILPLNSLGLALMGLGRYAEAAPAFDEALEIARAHEHWMLGIVLTGAADLRLREGDAAGSLAKSGEALAALESAFPEDTRADESWRFRLLDSVRGAALDHLGRHAEAAPLLLAAVPALSERFGEASLFAVDAMGRVVQHFEMTGNAREASRWRQRLKKALAARAQD